MGDNSQSWACVCGNINSGNFCINCGKNRAEGEVKKPENDVPSVGTSSVATAAAVTTAAVTAPQTVPAQPQMQQVQPQYQQPVQQYVQQPAQPMQPQYQQNYQPAPAAMSEDEEFIRNKKISNRFSLISLILHYGCPIVFGIITAIGNGIGTDASEAFASVLGLGIGLGVTASYVLMIIARVKCRKAAFGKVLMWVYIIELILEIITFVVVVVWFINMLSQCNF